MGSWPCQQTHFFCTEWCHRNGLDEGKVKETLTLLTSLNYLHIPICHPDHSQGHMKDGPGQRRVRENTPQTWHLVRESSMTCREEKHKWPAGISQSECQKSSQLFILAGAKRASEQVVQPSASGATEEGKKMIKGTRPGLMWVFYCITFGLYVLFFFHLPGTFAIFHHYYA